MGSFSVTAAASRELGRPLRTLPMFSVLSTTLTLSSDLLGLLLCLASVLALPLFGLLGRYTADAESKTTREDEDCFHSLL